MKLGRIRFYILTAVSALALLAAPATGAGDRLAGSFLRPPPAFRPWVYWMWMDGNLSREGITADLEAMKRAGIGGVIIMEVNVGIPQGPVKFMGPEWRELFKHVAAEAARLGLEIDLNASPGWTGSGGPWIKPEQSMQRLVFSETNISGPQVFEGKIAEPKSREGFYRDVALLAFRTPTNSYRIDNIQEKALFHRGHYSSEQGVPSSLHSGSGTQSGKDVQGIPVAEIVDLTRELNGDGRLKWEVPAGAWTVIRFGRTSTGANTRPAPLPGLGLECDKLDSAALDGHFQEFIGKLMGDIGTLTGKSLVSLHIDSWEMGPQNWTGRFREEFQRLRGYDPLAYLPVMTGRVVENAEVSERFLWDVRQTVQDLIVEKHAVRLRELAHRHGMKLSIEPYDGTPCDDLTLGAVADVPMCEFWLYGFNTSFSCIEAASIAHTYGQRVVAAEAFTSTDAERWQAHPGSMKILGDWAFCAGVNRFVFHRYQHQPWTNRWPGMTMGPYGVHHERTQTWWEMSTAYHEYLARCQFMLQQGLAVADVCYLSPEGAPNVFRPPASAAPGTPPERLGYNFDGCTPEALVKRMAVKDGALIMPDGMTYRVLILPERRSVTPAVLRKIKELVQAGATIIGPPPIQSPSLAGFPECDREVRKMAEELWGKDEVRTLAASESSSKTPVPERVVGRGKVLWDRGFTAGQSARKTANEDQGLGNAKWIWRKEGNPAVSAPVGTRYFRRSLVLEQTSNIESAHILMTADNSFELYVNGDFCGSGDNFHFVYDFDVASLLKAGTNELRVVAVNGADFPNPAGLIGAMHVRLRDGTTREVITDRTWEAAEQMSAKWAAAMELGGFGMGPWGTPRRATVLPQDYVGYDMVASRLKKMGVPPDFETDARLRYTHRRDGDTEIYFVANPEEKSVMAGCTFRISGKQPELWDPLTGKTRMLPVFRNEDGRTVVPMRFEPSQSFFFIFREPTKADTVATGTDRQTNFCNLEKVGEVTGTWEVEFDPKWGGPEKVSFSSLQDWATRPEAGIRYYSGTATYRKRFDAPQAIRENSTGTQVYLDLGEVKNMAQVRLNGKDLGILWCAPWRVDITGQLKPSGNELEIAVVNLWPNRVIGDEQFAADCAYNPGGELARWPEWLVKNEARPVKERFTFTTWKHFNKNSPLLPSGLLGPVVLKVQSP